MMAITPNELTNKENRTSRRNDLVQDLIIDKIYNKLPENFEAIILTDPFKDSSAETFSPPGGPSAEEAPPDIPNTNFYYLVRVRPIGVQDLILPDPFAVKFKNVLKKIINAHPIGYIEAASLDGSPPTVGDVYQCRYTTKDRRGIAIVKKLRKGTANFAAEDTISIADAFSGELPTLLGPRTSGSGFKTKGSVSITNQAELDFLTVLTSRLRNKGYNREVVVTSTTRTASQQAQAVIDQVNNNGISWYDTKYNSFTYKAQVRELLISSPINKDKMVEWMKKAMSEGNYMSAHMRSGAFDLRTNDLSFTEGSLLFKTTQEMKNAGLIRYTNWENVEDSTVNKEKRKTGAVNSIYGEHIHISLYISGKDE